MSMVRQPMKQVSIFSQKGGEQPKKMFVFFREINSEEDVLAR